MVVPNERLWSEEISETSGETEAALAVTHPMLGRKLYSESQRAKKADWYMGQRCQSLHSQLFVQSRNALYTKEVVLFLCWTFHCYGRLTNDY